MNTMVKRITARNVSSESIREINSAVDEYDRGHRTWPPVLQPFGARVTKARMRAGKFQVRSIYGTWMAPVNTEEVVLQ